jgi:hypothetical protein
MSLIPLSRRELLTSSIARGIGGTIFSTFALSQARSQESTEGDNLRAGVGFMSDKVSSNPSAAREWLQSAETIRATKNEFISDLHGYWASDFALRSTNHSFLVTLTPFIKANSTGVCRMGVAFHPWMHIDGYGVNRTLNVPEIQSLYPAATFFRRQLNLFENGTMAMVPFPDTPQLPINTLHEDTFVKIVLQAQSNPNAYRLHYARYYIMAGRTGSASNFIILVAHAYTLKDEPDTKNGLRIAYTSVSP